MTPRVRRKRSEPPIIVAICLSLLLIALHRPATSGTGIPPTVDFVVAPPPAGTVFYSVPFAWQGTDSDGSVSYYRYAVDPPPFPNADTFWVVTPDTTRQLFFQTSSLDLPLPTSGPVTFSQPHTVALQAVDDEGLRSPVVSRSFFTSTIAPEVQIVQPPPTQADVPVPTSVTLSWQGTDSDGVFIQRPVRYKYQLFGPGSFVNPNDLWFTPDLLRTSYAPDFADWNPTSGDTTTVRFTNLTPHQFYLFCVVAFDEAGAYSARFARAVNMIRLRTDIVTPTLVSLVSAEADVHGVRLKWLAPAGGSVVASVYRRTPDSGWLAVAPVNADGAGSIAYEDRTVESGSRYGYRLGILGPTGEQFFGETWITVPAAAVLSLEGPRPNPADRDLMVSFSLPTAQPAAVELLDVTGRILARHAVDAKPGSHVVQLRETRTMAPGIYLVRLTQANSSVMRKVCVVH